MYSCSSQTPAFDIYPSLLQEGGASFQKSIPSTSMEIDRVQMMTSDLKNAQTKVD
jgi:hypothetical protein